MEPPQEGLHPSVNLHKVHGKKKAHSRTTQKDRPLPYRSGWAVEQRFNAKLQIAAVLRCIGQGQSWRTSCRLCSFKLENRRRHSICSESNLHGCAIAFNFYLALPLLAYVPNSRQPVFAEGEQQESKRVFSSDVLMLVRQDNIPLLHRQ